ncbi:hypothetical protein V8F20_000784 [Naviculisporaceae sp. PSN 640]
MSRPWILVAPSKNGIGYALTRHLLMNTHPSIPILAAGVDKDKARHKTSLLEGLPDRKALRDRLHTLPMDMTSESTIASVSRRAASLFPPETHHLHLAFCLADPDQNLGTEEGRNHGSEKQEETETGQSLDAFKQNAVFPMMMMKHFRDFLPQHKDAQPFLHHYRTSTDDTGSDGVTRIIRAEDDDLVDKNPPSTWDGSAGGYGGPGEARQYSASHSKAQTQPRREQPAQNHMSNPDPPSTGAGSAGGYGGPGEARQYSRPNEQVQTQPEHEQPAQNHRDMSSPNPPSTRDGSASGYGGPGEARQYSHPEAQAQAQSQPEPAQLEQSTKVHKSNPNPPSTWAGSAGGYGGPGESNPYHEAQGQAQAQSQSQPQAQPQSQPHAQPQRPQNQPPVKDKPRQESQSQSQLKFQTLPPHAIWTNLSIHAPESITEELRLTSQSASDSLTRTFDDQLKHQKAQALAISYSTRNPNSNNNNLKDDAAKMVDIILNLKASQRGRIWNSKGKEVSPSPSPSA